MKRINELDLAKSFVVIISMIGIHTMYDLAELKTTVWSSTLNVLATAEGAPVFMFCLGVTLGFSKCQKAADRLRRGIRLFTLGMAINVLRYAPMAYTSYATGDPELMKGLAMIFNADIFQFAGLAFMLLALCIRIGLGAWGILMLSIVMNVAGTLLIGHHTSSYVVNQLLGYFYHTPTCSCFTLMNWFIFIAAGNVMGRIYHESDNPDKWFRYLTPICGTIAIVHQYLSITGTCPLFKTLENDWEYYSMATPDALCIAFGVAPFVICLFRLIGRRLPDSWMDVLGQPSRYIKHYFCFSWIWIMWISCFLYFIPKATTFGTFVLWWLGIVALTVVSVNIYNRYFKDKLIATYVSHSWLWNILVMAVIIAFGAWFFTTIPGPYIMPY